MSKLVHTDSANTVRGHVRPIDWRHGHEYGIRVRITDEWPGMFLSYGDGRGDAFTSWDFEGKHKYPKDSSLPYIVELNVVGDCVCLKELSIGCWKNVKELDLTNCRQLERFSVCGYSSDALTNIKISNDCPLQEVPEKIYYGLHLFAEYLPEMQND